MRVLIADDHRLIVEGIKRALDDSPDFEVVGKALGPSTAAMTSEPDGWFIKGVLMTK